MKALTLQSNYVVWSNQNLAKCIDLGDLLGIDFSYYLIYLSKIRFIIIIIGNTKSTYH